MSTGRIRSSLARAAALAAVLAGAVPAVAAADALTYADGNNVWMASPDGAVKRAVTTDGVATDYYKWPSLDDSGNVVAIKGYSTHQAIVVTRPDGSRTVNVMPWKTSTFGNFGPTFARVKPTTGSILTYTYLWNHGPYDGGTESRFAQVTPTAPGDPGNPMVDQPGRDRPTWWGDHLVGSDGTQIVYEYQPLQFRSWLGDNSGARLVGAEVSRPGDRVLVAYGDNRLGLLAYQGTVGDPTGGSVVDGCYLPVQAPASGYITWALSPDGRRVAWGDGAGLHVAGVDPHPGPGNGPCELQGHVLLSATGTQPAFSAAPAPSNGTGPAGPGPVGPAPKPAPVPQPVKADPLPVVATSTTTSTALRRGLTVGVRVKSAGTVRATLTGGGISASTTMSVKRAGSVRVTLRLSAAAKRRLARLKGKRLTLRITFTPRHGRRVVSTRTVRVR